MPDVAKTAKLAHRIAGDVHSTANQVSLAAATAARVTRGIPQTQPVSQLAGQVALTATQVSGAALLAQAIAHRVIVVQSYTTRTGRRVRGYMRKASPEQIRKLFERKR